MATTTCHTSLPASIERDLNILGVRRAFFFVAAPVGKPSFQKTVLDENGNPEF